MAEITFYYGTMGSGKSTYVLQLNHSLLKEGFRPLLIKPTSDTRDVGIVKSRIGIEYPAKLISPDEVLLLKYLPTHIIVDEAQFLSNKNIEDIRFLVDEYDINAFFFGLRTNYSGNLFEATAKIMAIADHLSELPMIYKDGHKANMHIRYVDGQPVFDGGSIFVGDIDEEYESVSRKQYYTLKNRYNKKVDNSSTE